MLDGSVAAHVGQRADLRHLEPAPPDAGVHAENLETKHVDDEIHPGETVEEKISLSERFGLWVSFYPFNQDEYLDIVAQWLRHFGVSAGRSRTARAEALQWALQRGSRSGRVAWQFARDWAGRARMRARSRSNRWRGRRYGAARARSSRRGGDLQRRRRFLLAQRPPGKVYAGYWEFPGGKVEPGEAAAARSRASCTRSSAST